MPRGRKKKYVRPRIECDCDVCGTTLEYPYVHIKLERAGYLTPKPAKGEKVTGNKDLPGAVVGYYCDQDCYRETL
tara:strand:- start:35 stop:259 length:225 start_codon:yes stop_codon:yes gene_type:complete